MLRAATIASTSRSGSATSAAISAKRLGVQRDQRLAQVLARVHLGLAPGLRRRVGDGARRARAGRGRSNGGARERRSVGRRHGVAGAGGVESGSQRRAFAMIAHRPCASRRRPVVRAGSFPPPARESGRGPPFAPRRSLPRTTMASDPAAAPLAVADPDELERVAAAVLSAAGEGRRHRRRDRRVAGGGAERHGAPRRSRDHRLQPRQEHRRHRLPRPAARSRQHRRFFRRRDSRHRRQGAGDRPLHRAGSGFGPGRPRPPGQAHSRPRPLPPLGPLGRRRHRARPRGRGGGTRGRPPAHQHRGLDGRLQRGRVRLRQLARLRRRLQEFAPPHRLLGDRRGRRRDAARLLVHGGARAVRPPARGDRRPHRRRAHGAAPQRVGRSRRPSARCCSRPPRPAT